MEHIIYNEGLTTASTRADPASFLYRGSLGRVMPGVRRPVLPCKRFFMNRQKISLVEPTAKLEAEFLAMANEFLAAGDERYSAELTDLSGYLERISRYARAGNLPPDRVPGDEFWLLAFGDRILGRSKLRHRLTPALEREGGHIGYDIRPSERRKGYGTLILKLTLEKARGLGLERVLLTCDTDNVASAGVIVRNGGEMRGRAITGRSGKMISRYWIRL